LRGFWKKHFTGESKYDDDTKSRNGLMKWKAQWGRLPFYAIMKKSCQNKIFGSLKVLEKEL
jgi:hypothetical protein